MTELDEDGEWTRVVELDAAGRVAAQILRSGVRSDLTTDAAGRMVRLATTDETGAPGYQREREYAEHGGLLRDAMWREGEEVRADSYGYDARGNLAWSTREERGVVTRSVTCTLRCD